MPGVEVSLGEPGGVAAAVVDPGEEVAGGGEPLFGVLAGGGPQPELISPSHYTSHSFGNRNERGP